MVNPGISRDGKYPQNLENWEDGEILDKKTKFCCISLKRVSYLVRCVN